MNQNNRQDCYLAIMPIELRKRRMITGTAVICVAFLLLVFSLIKTQIIDGEEYKLAADSLSVSTQTVKAPRGEILDVNGNPLVTNRQGYSVVFKNADFPSAKNQEERNELIYSLITLFEKNGVQWIDRLPIAEKDGEFVVDENKLTEFKYMVSENMLEMEKGEKSTAKECLDALIKRYKLEKYSISDARKIASVCFGMKYLGFSVSNPYTFAEDVPSEIISVIMEKSSTYKGVDSETVSYREYSDTVSYSHILGVVGSISADEYEMESKLLKEKLSDESLTAADITKLKNNAYTLNDKYGKSGIEYAMEKYLRGTNGTKATTISGDGTAREEYITTPVQGNTVVTTIDAELQKIATEALQEMLIENKNSSYFDVAGAMVVINCKTGAILANVSLPTYDITRYFEDYDKLIADTQSPLWNRGMQSAYAPGSTMKPVVALAALEEGVATTETAVECKSYYTLEDQHFKCLNRHGYQNVYTALENSCNIYFFEMGRKLGIDKMNKYASLFGLGQETGVELPEAEGVLASIANKEAAGQTWNPGDTVQAAIGQSDNLFTPVQLANYCATIANGGTRYRPYIIKSVLSADMSEIIYETQPQVINTLNVSKENLDIVKEGMHRVVLYSNCKPHYQKCIVDAAGKTGTSQVMKKTAGGETVVCNNGFFITFAPYDDPEIAIAIVAENAQTGGLTSKAAVPVYNYYFGSKTEFEAEELQNNLIP